MHPGVVASIVCPVCGQPFLCQQQAAEGMVTCPHCAHQAFRSQFVTQGQTASLATVRRRVSRPLMEATPPPMWPQPVTQPLIAGETAPPSAAAPMQPAQPVYTPPPSVAEPVVWRQPPAQMSSAMLPTQTAPEVPDDALPAEFVPPHLQKSPARGFALAAVFLCALGGGAWVWWDMQQAAPARGTGSFAALPPAPATEPPPEVRKAAIASQTETAAAAHPPPDVPAFTQDVKTRIDALFKATTAEERAACVHEGARHTAQIEALLGPGSTQPPRLHTLGALKDLSLALPGGPLMPLFNLGTSTCKHGALVRLVEGPDGQRRIDWPLLFETHQQTLITALRDKPDEPVWAWARLVPSHGFDIPATDRARFLAFDLHVTAEGKTPITACVERDSPLGRFLDRETDWRQSYLARLLVRKLGFGTGTTIVAIADCEGTPAQSP